MTSPTPTPSRPDDFTAGTDGGGNPMPPMPFEPEEDYVDGPSTDALLGLELEYTYSKGSRYKLIFDDEHHVTFRMLDHPLEGTDSGMRPPVLDYRAREIRDGLIMGHWIVKPASIHVALTIDLTENKIHVGAMMPPNRWEFFDTAVISSITKAG